MRPPVVKRQTTPRSGFLAFFPLGWSRRSRPLGTCPDLLAVCRDRPHVAAPHTAGGSPPAPWRGPRVSARFAAPSHPRCPLLPSSATAGLHRGMRQCVPGAGRGSPRHPAGTLAVFYRPGGEQASPPRRRGRTKRREAPGRAEPPWAAGWQSPGPRRLLSGPRAAAGSPAPLPSPGSKGSISPPVGRRNIAETARPSGWAHMVKA